MKNPNNSNKKEDVFDILKRIQENNKIKKEENLKNNIENTKNIEKNSLENQNKIQEITEITKEKVKINSKIETVNIGSKIFEYKIVDLVFENKKNFFIKIKIRDKNKKNFSVFEVNGKFDNIFKEKQLYSENSLHIIRGFKIFRIKKTDRYNGGTVFNNYYYYDDNYKNIFSFNFFKKFFQVNNVNVDDILAREIKNFIINRII